MGFTIAAGLRCGGSWPTWTARRRHAPPDLRRLSSVVSAVIVANSGSAFPSGQLDARILTGQGLRLIGCDLPLEMVREALAERSIHVDGAIADETGAGVRGPL